MLGAISFLSFYQCLSMAGVLYTMVSYSPKFRGYENIFSLANPLFETPLEGFSNLHLVAIDMSTVDVYVAGLQSSLHSCTNFTWFREPRSVEERERDREKDYVFPPMVTVYTETPPLIIIFLIYIFNFTPQGRGGRGAISVRKSLSHVRPFI